MNARVTLYEGANILFPEGPRIVVAVGPFGYTVRDVTGGVHEVSWTDVQPARAIVDGRVDAVAESLMAVLSGLSDDALQESLDKLEVVLTMRTGFALGHPALARPGEPYSLFNPARKVSDSKKCEAMATILAREALLDRRRQRNLEAGKATPRARVGAVSQRQLMNWLADFDRPINGGLLALVDKRRVRRHSAFGGLDPEVRRIADDIAARIDGTQAVRSIDELLRRTLLALKAEGLDSLDPPESTLRTYLTQAAQAAGRTTRSHTTKKLRGVLALTAYPALRPGQVVAIDVTRSDTFCVDPWTGKPISVEIITALDVCTRVVLALRVVPRSANAIEAGLILYDVLRPFSQVVEPGQVHDWRWAGVPETIGSIEDAVAEAERLSARPLLGEHPIPGLLPDAIRADKGSIFTGRYFREVCTLLGIHLLLSRGKKPTDNAFVERWHETLQRCLLQLSGHKGRNVSQRGSDAGKIVVDKKGRAVFKGDGPGLTPRELELRLREFICTDYHRTRHGGLTVVDRTMEDRSPAVGMTPLEVFDALLAAVGRLHVLQRPDLLYDLLPQLWLTIRHDGVEYKDLTFDCEELDDFRSVPKGFFRDQDRAAPFFMDPRDLSRLWFRRPDTGAVVEVPWRRAFQLQAPMTDLVLDAATKAVKRRGGTNTTINKDSVQREILEAVNDIASIDRLRANPDLVDWKPNKVAAAHLRESRSQFDHAEAAEAGARGTRRTRRGASAKGSRADASRSGTAPTFDPTQTAWPTLESQEGGVVKASRLHAQAYAPPLTPPPTLTRAEAAAMSEAKRREYAREVRRYLNGHYFDSERDRRIRQVLNDLIEDNAEMLTGTREVALLTGFNVLGKSTVLYQLSYAVHRHHVGPDGDPARMARRTATRRFGGRDQEIHPTHAPVLFLSLEAATTVTRFNELVVEAFDMDKSTAKKASTLDLVLEHGVRLLVIDDLHQLILTERLGRYALDHLKAIVTALGEYGITVIFSGANLHEHDVMSDPQITGRAYEIAVAPYGCDTRDQVLAWQRFLKESGDVIAPFLPAAEPGMLHNDLPGLILDRTHGRMQAIVNLLRRATVAAIEDGTWAVTENHVLAVPASKLTADELAKRADKSAAKPTQLHPTVSVTQHGQVTG